MKTNDLQKKSEQDLRKMLGESKAKLQQLRFDLPGGKIKNVREIRKLRKEVARILTLLQQRQQ